MAEALVKIADLSWNIRRTEDDMATINKISGLITGQYGVVVPLSVVDKDGTAIDLSAYTAALIRAVSPDARTTLQFTGAFVSATGGTISFTPDSANTFDRDGMWEGQAQFSDTGLFSLSVIFALEVDKQI